LPDETRISVLNFLAQSRRPARRASQLSPGAWTWLIGAVCALIAFVVYHPWPSYQWASMWDSVPAYEFFLERFEGAAYSAEAQERLRKLREDDVWEAARVSGEFLVLRNYLRVYRDGKYRAEALAMIQQIADAEWIQIANTREEGLIHGFLMKFPETTKQAAAEARIRELHNDWYWVRGQDKLEYYRAFAAKFPNHPESAWIDKRIIDLEVAAIAAGNFGEMPKADVVSLGGSAVDVEVENGTGYVLTILYSGADSKRLVVPIGAKGSVVLKPGNYEFAASVAAADVSNYYGSAVMHGGTYSSRFYIETSYTGGGSSRLPLPGFSPSRNRR
ncbi:MAG TPA: hypothetical protein VD994_06105, partial [Prosthecobacter sp.]|nr:hypothetical protein [Prosthecobacter sp.]